MWRNKLKPTCACFLGADEMLVDAFVESATARWWSACSCIAERGTCLFQCLFKFMGSQDIDVMSVLKTFNDSNGKCLSLPRVVYFTSRKEAKSVIHHDIDECDVRAGGQLNGVRTWRRCYPFFSKDIDIFHHVYECNMRQFSAEFKSLCNQSDQIFYGSLIFRAQLVTNDVLLSVRVLEMTCIPEPRGNDSL
jgi:hypothetical protein